MSDSTKQIDELQSWIGRQEINVDYVTIPLVARLAATLDRNDPQPKIGDPLPADWHWTLFPRVVPRSQIGRDGHPQLGDFLAPVPLPRRMFAGNRSTFHADLLVDGQHFVVCAEPENDSDTARLWVARDDGMQIPDGNCEFA